MNFEGFSFWEYFSKYAKLLENETDDGLEKFLSSVKQTKENDIFWFGVYNYEIYKEICNHKIKLGDFIIQATKINAVPEDRMRIILFLANDAELDLAKTNFALKTEFGPSFQLQEKYSYKDKTISWKDLAIKSRKIKNGFWNHACLITRSNYLDIFGYYKLDSNTDPKKIELIDKLSLQIIKEIIPNVELSPKLPRFQELLKKIEEFYKLNNRIGLDLESLQSETNFEKILGFVTNAKIVAQIKLDLIKSNIPVTNLEAARRYIKDKVARVEMEKYISIEELERFGMPLGSKQIKLK